MGNRQLQIQHLPENEQEPVPGEQTYRDQFGDKLLTGRAQQDYSINEEKLMMRPSLIPFRGVSAEIKEKLVQAVSENNTLGIQSEAAKFMIAAILDDIILVDLSGNHSYQTILHTACGENANNCVRYALQYMYRNFKKYYRDYVNIMTSSRDTPILICCKEGSYECAELLLRYGGIDLSILGSRELSVSYYAEKDDKIRQLLNKYPHPEKINQAELMKNDQMKAAIAVEKNQPLVLPEDGKIPEQLLARGKSIQYTGKNSDHRKKIQDIKSRGKFFSDNQNQQLFQEIELEGSMASQIRFHRPCQIFKGNLYQLFDGISPDDVKLGANGSCYYLATIASMAQRPNKIRSMFKTGVNIFGFYVIELFIDGVPKEIKVDDRFPCTITKKEPILCKPNGYEIWSMLLQKAWLKQFKDFDNASSIPPEIIIEDLAGAPSKGYFVKPGRTDCNALFSNLLARKAEGCLLIATSNKQTDDSAILKCHNFSILDAKEKGNVKLIKIRNPLTTAEWEGEYGDNSTKWTAELQEYFGMVKEKDGIFFLTPDEFVRIFGYYCEIYLKEDYIYNYINVSSKSYEHKYFTFTLTRKQIVNLRFFQKFLKYRANQNEGYTAYSAFKFETVRVDGQPELLDEGDERRLKGSKSVHFSSKVFLDLNPGKYMVHIQVKWNNQKVVNSGVLGLYANEESKLSTMLAEAGEQILKKAYFNKTNALPQNRWTSRRNIGELAELNLRTTRIIALRKSYGGVNKADLKWKVTLNTREMGNFVADIGKSNEKGKEEVLILENNSVVTIEKKSADDYAYWPTYTVDPL